LNVTDFIENGQGEDATHTGNGSQYTQGDRIVLFGLPFQVFFQFAEFTVIALDDG
jgi:hypothetical protein